MKITSFLPVLLAIILFSCKNEPPIVIPKAVKVEIQTDKAAYAPGDPVNFTLDKAAPASAKIRYKHLHEVIAEVAYSATSWNWTPPTDDFKGYLVEVYSLENGTEILHGSIAVDVSSDWTRFPRYGFLSKYSGSEPIATVIGNLNRYHLNGLQFYDWHYKHHHPIAGTGTNPESSWVDIINRTIYFSTVEQYIQAAHDKNMKAMFYNLAFGATKTAESDGVQPGWFMFKDQTHTNRDFHPLPQPPFNSDIFLTNPGNPDWQQYLLAQNQEVYTALDFDGYHIDQLGDRGKLYDYNGAAINLTNGYKSFTDAMKAGNPDKYLVFNAVNQFGQGSISQSPVNVLYTEVWGPNEGYKDLSTIIANNDFFGSNQKKTILAAYMNYDLAQNPGAFNTSSVLFADAVIFAFGGSHLELGEHMLGREYFPNDNLQMSAELTKALPVYYDFLVAYQNVLRDGGSLFSPTISSVNDQFPLKNWPPDPGKIAVAGRNMGNRQVLHFFNFLNSQSVDWRDTNGTRMAPNNLSSLNMQVSADVPVKSVWFASPDVNGGSAQTVTFTQTGNQVAFTLPSLTYWSMVVLEF